MELPSLRTNQRNVFVKAVRSLEERKLIEIERTGSNFQAWKVKLLIPIENIILK
jgi:hypothetical protein